eukprot:TRINITY_DN14837_c1_g6_i2.p1 TRINITY_DN14837_c1_g6~~TRINITY_DN14837_c1_g6_i2.p1  ORF type:complete len:100 (-),score=12.98 TRINITY_DN14837_c1_g6_i2:358-657(-)
MTILQALLCGKNEKSYKPLEIAVYDIIISLYQKLKTNLCFPVAVRYIFPSGNVGEKVFSSLLGPDLPRMLLFCSLMISVTISSNPIYTLSNPIYALSVF